MRNSVVDHLRTDLDCEDLLECVHGLTDLDRSCYQALTASEEPLTVDEIAEAVGRERSTAYRSVRRLLEAGFVTKDQVNYDHGGYYHVYRPVDPESVADELGSMVDEWHAEMRTLIDEFRERYGERVRAEPLLE